MSRPRFLVSLFGTNQMRQTRRLQTRQRKTKLLSHHHLLAESLIKSHQKQKPKHSPNRVSQVLGALKLSSRRRQKRVVVCSNSASVTKRQDAPTKTTVKLDLLPAVNS